MTMEAAATLDKAPDSALDDASSEPLPAPAQAPAPTDNGRILGLRVPVAVSLAERKMSLHSILEITMGTIIEFDVPFDAELTLCVANRRIGRGKAVKVGENFGLRITRIETIHDRIDAISGR